MRSFGRVNNLINKTGRMGMTRDKAIETIERIDHPRTAAQAACLAIVNFSDWEMADGDAARAVAQAWLNKFAGDEA